MSAVAEFYQLRPLRRAEIILWFLAFWSCAEALQLEFGIELGFAVYYGWPAVVLTGLARMATEHYRWGTPLPPAEIAQIILEAVLVWPLSLPLRRSLLFEGSVDSERFLFLMAPVVVAGTFIRAAALALSSYLLGTLPLEEMIPMTLMSWSEDAAGAATFLPMILVLVGPWLAPHQRPPTKCSGIFAAMSFLSVALILIVSETLPGAHFKFWFLVMPFAVCAAWLLNFEYATAYLAVVNVTLGLLRFTVPSGASLAEEQVFLTVLAYLALYMAAGRATSLRLIEMFEGAHRRTSEAIQEHSYFLSMLSHELRTPFNLIIGYSTLGEPGAKAANSALKAVQRAARQLLDLVNKMTLLGSAGFSLRLLDSQVVDLKQLVNGLIRENKTRAAEKGIVLKAELEGITRRVIKSPVCLNFAIRELLDNAIKFSGHGEITLTVEPDGNSLRFSIQDEGIGLSEDQRTGGVKTFEQIEKGYGRRFQGLGIGLSFVALLVEILHGHLDIESNPRGPGARFSFVIPS